MKKRYLSLLASAALLLGACGPAEPEESETLDDVDASLDDSSEDPGTTTSTYDVTFVIDFLSWENWMTSAIVKGAWDSWTTETTLVYDSSALTLTGTVTMAPGIYEFGVQIYGDFTGQDSTWLWLNGTAGGNASLDVNTITADTTVKWSAITHGAVGDVSALSEGEISVYDGTEDNPWTVAELTVLLHKLTDDSKITRFETDNVYVTGEVTSSGTVTNYNSYNIFLGDIELYSIYINDGLLHSTLEANELVGSTVTAYGIAMNYNGQLEVGYVSANSSTDGQAHNGYVTAIEWANNGAFYLSDTSVTLDVGGTASVTATLYGSSDTSAISWTSGNESVATVAVGEDGVATISGVAAGSTTITVTTGTFSKSVSVEVLAAGDLQAAITFNVNGTANEDNTALTWTDADNIVTLTMAKGGCTDSNWKNLTGTGSSDYTAGTLGHLRAYAFVSLTVEAGGNSISQVSFACQSEAYASTLAEQAWGDGVTASSSGSTTTLAVENLTSLTVSEMSAQVRLTSMTVTYTVSN